MSNITEKKKYLPQTYLCVPNKVYQDISASKVNSKMISLYFTIKLLIAENPAELKYLSVYLKEDVKELNESLKQMEDLGWITIDNANESVQLV